jgi:hypothetical protein
MYHYVLHPSESVLRMNELPHHLLENIIVQIDEWYNEGDLLTL